MFHFHKTCLKSLKISSLFSGRIIISSTFLGFSSGFTILSSFDLATASVILFPINSPVLWTTFWKHLLKNLVLFPIIVYYKFPDPLTYFLVLDSIEISRHFYLLISNVKLISSAISNGLPF